MKFLVDAHLPRRLCRQLVEAGHDAIHTTELPAGNRTADGDINQLSVAEGRVVVSKDTDFYYSHLLMQRPQKLLLVRTGNIGVRELCEVFQHHLPEILAALETNSLVELYWTAIRVVV